jgi:hypothetical protein
MMTKALTYDSGAWLYTKKNVTALRKMSDELADLFNFDETVEGEEYWDSACSALYRIADNIEKRFGTNGEKL